MKPMRFAPSKRKAVAGLDANADRQPSALFLTEALSDINQGAGFLDILTLDEINAVRRHASIVSLKTGETVFMQGDQHQGIYLIENGRVRTYYAGPSGREVTLAYWTEGHFIGGPEVFGGTHMWSATAVEAVRLTFLSGSALRLLVQTIPSFAICIIEGLAAKGRCYSALVQMLGTRSVMERLAQLILILAQVQGRPAGADLIIERKITYEQIAAIVGSTRQWVTSALRRFERQGFITVKRTAIVVHTPVNALQNLDLTTMD